MSSKIFVCCLGCICSFSSLFNKISGLYGDFILLIFLSTCQFSSHLLKDVMSIQLMSVINQSNFMSTCQFSSHLLKDVMSIQLMSVLNQSNFMSTCQFSSHLLKDVMSIQLMSVLNQSNFMLKKECAIYVSHFEIWFVSIGVFCKSDYPYSRNNE